jgi:Zierdtviridae exonuclease
MPSVEIPHLRTSERKSFKRCPQQWQWRYRDWLVPKVTRPDARWFGTGVHLALAERYKYKGTRRGANVLKVWREFAGEEHAAIRVVKEDEAEWLDARELGEAMLGEYLDTYGKDEEWYVLSTEQTFEVPIRGPKPQPPIKELRNPVVLQGPMLTYYNGTFDGVRLDLRDDSIWLWENKTAAQIRLTHLALDDQAGGYFAVAPDVLRAMGIKLAGNIEGIMYDFLRKAKPDDRPRNAEGLVTNKPTKQHYINAFAAAGYTPLVKSTPLDAYERFAVARNITVLGDVSARQPTKLLHREPVSRTRNERRTQIKRVQDEALWINAIDNGVLPVLKNPSIDHCGYCDYAEMCELHEQRSDWEEYRSLAFREEDPYADHRESSADE